MPKWNDGRKRDAQRTHIGRTSDALDALDAKRTPHGRHTDATRTQNVDPAYSTQVSSL